MAKSVEPITAITPELLAMTWSTVGSCKMWLNRRGSSAEKLGLVIRGAPDGGVCLLSPEEEAVAADPSVPDEAQSFETWATQVDRELQAAQEEAEPDDVLLSLFEVGRTPGEAVAAIIAHRVAELAEEQPAAEPEPATAPAASEPAPEVAEVSEPSAVPLEPLTMDPETWPTYCLRLGLYHSLTKASAQADWVAMTLGVDVQVTDLDGNVVHRAAAA